VFGNLRISNAKQKLFPKNPKQVLIFAKNFITMKRLSLLILLVLAVLGQTFSQVAEKVGEEKAFQIAKAFVNSQTKFQNAELQLVSNADLFIYNIGNQGFAILPTNFSSKINTLLSVNPGSI
jgi:hypothetical protein